MCCKLQLIPVHQQRNEEDPMPSSLPTTPTLPLTCENCQGPFSADHQCHSVEVKLAQSMLDPVDIYFIANIVANVSSWNMTAKPKHPQKCNRISNFSLMIILPRGRELQISY